MALPKNNFRIEGLEELIDDLNKFGKEAKKEMRPVVDEAGEIILKATKNKVPVNTGSLKESLHLKRKRSNKMLVESYVTWGDDVRDYAAPLELGHELVFMGRRTLKHVFPRPFLRPAADENKENIFKLIINGMDRALKKFGDKK